MRGKCEGCDYFSCGYMSQLGNVLDAEYGQFSHRFCCGCCLLRTRKLKYVRYKHGHRCGRECGRAYAALYKELGEIMQSNEELTLAMAFTYCTKSPLDEQWPHVDRSGAGCSPDAVGDKRDEPERPDGFEHAWVTQTQVDNVREQIAECMASWSFARGYSANKKPKLEDLQWPEEEQEWPEEEQDGDMKL